MGDKLNEIYNAWKAAFAGEPSEFQAFQGGFTAGAVAMRERAQALAEADSARNAIGELSDIPE